MSDDNQQQQQQEVIEVEIDKLDFDICDSRNPEKDRTKTKQDEIIDEKTHIEYLCESIQKYGQIDPIKITKKKKENGHYSIIAGRYRTLAFQKLRLKKINAIILDTKDPDEIEDIAYEDNAERLNYDREEKLNYALYRFTRKGYTNEEIMYLAKKYYNFGDKNIPKDFVKIVKTSRYSPNTIYQYMQTHVQLSPTIRKMAIKYNLTLHQRIMLTNSRLRKHPELQKILIKQISNRSQKISRLLVAQTIRDLETGAIERQGRTSSYMFDPTSREKISEKEPVEKSQVEKYLEIIKVIDDLMYSVTGHRITRGEFKYTSKHVEYSEYHRLEILKNLTRSEVLNLEADLEVLGDAVRSFLYLIQKEVMKE